MKAEAGILRQKLKYGIQFCGGSAIVGVVYPVRIPFASSPMQWQGLRPSNSYRSDTGSALKDQNSRISLYRRSSARPSHSASKRLRQLWRGPSRQRGHRTRKCCRFKATLLILRATPAEGQYHATARLKYSRCRLSDDVGLCPRGKNRPRRCRPVAALCRSATGNSKTPSALSDPPTPRRQTRYFATRLAKKATALS